MSYFLRWQKRVSILSKLRQKNCRSNVGGQTPLSYG
jgi:hypothetical protein